MAGYFVDVVFALAGVGPPRFRFPLGPRVPRPRWWRLVAVVALIAQGLPIVLGSFLAVRGSLTAANDDFLFVLGFVFLGVAMMVLVFAFVVVAWIGQVVYRVVTERSESRWLVVAVGACDVLVGLLILFAPAGRVVLPAWLIVWGLALVILGAYAPSVVSPGDGAAFES